MFLITLQDDALTTFGSPCDAMLRVLIEKRGQTVLKNVGKRYITAAA